MPHNEGLEQLQLIKSFYEALRYKRNEEVEGMIAHAVVVESLRAFAIIDLCGAM